MIRTAYIYTKYLSIVALSSKKLKKVREMKDDQKAKEKEDYIFNYITGLSETLLKESRVDLTVTGVDNIPEGPVLFVSNHQGAYDIPVLISGIPKRKGFIAKKELEKRPLFGNWMKEAHCIFLDREDNREALKSIIKAMDYLRKGRSMLIFPEGEKTCSKQMTPFKAGSFKIATKTKVPIVPVTLNGTYKVIEANNGFIRPTAVELHIHPPIDTKKISKEEEAKLHLEVEKIIKSKLA